MKRQNYMVLEFPSKSINESFARAAVACFASQLAPTTEELQDIRAAVSEAVSNCIKFAYPDEVGSVTIRCRILQNNTLDIIIKDKGVGIGDVEQATRPLFTTAGRESSGMGFTIMESFMTECKVVSTSGKGTTIHMKRRIAKRI